MENPRKYKHIPNEVRSLLIRKIEAEDANISEAARDLHINRTAAYEILKKYHKTGKCEKSTVRGAPKKKITDEILEFIERNIERNKSMTLKALQKACNERFHVNLAIETIRRAISKLGITMKRNTLILDRVNDPERIAIRKIFAEEFLTTSSVDDTRNIFVDETGFNLHMRRSYGRSKKGRRVNTTVPTIRGRNTTLLAAINSTGIVYYKIFTGSCNSQIFIEFLKELDEILVNRFSISDGCIYMDNARPHISRQTKNSMETLRNACKFLSPYSYMLNPIEFAFSKIKCYVRELLGDAQEYELSQLITTSISNVQSVDAVGWYRLIRRNCALAMQMHSFD